jgi:hypothetical protein
MTDRIDLDDIDAGEQDDEDDANAGDWIWRDDADSDDAPVSTQSAASAPVGPSSADSGSGEGDATDGNAMDGDAATADTPAGDTANDTQTAAPSESDVPSPTIRDARPDSDQGGGANARPDASPGSPQNASGDSDANTDTDASGEARVPHVPRENQNSPVGIPKETGGAGAGNEVESDAGGANAPDSAASGPHGGGVDDMATALTYEAAKRLANPAAAVADATVWSDWIGIVGDVPAHVIGTFQRNNGVDADFFNGTGTGPGERLAEIDEHSMFYSERMVVVGVESEDEYIAERADWEFVPLADAAAKANWELQERS